MKSSLAPKCFTNLYRADSPRFQHPLAAPEFLFFFTELAKFTYSKCAVKYWNNDELMVKVENNACDSV